MSSSIRRTTIDANGNLVTIQQGDATGESPSSSSETTNLLSTLQSIQTVDTFGFNIPTKQFYIGLAILAFMIGLRGAFVFLMALGCYNLYMRSTGGGSNSGRWSRGAVSRGSWGRGGGGGGGGGSNIRGISDLPCDPKVG